MTDMSHPLVGLAQRLPWDRIEKALASHFARQVRPDCQVEKDDLLGRELLTASGSVSTAGRSRLSIRLLVSLRYLKNASTLVTNSSCSVGQRTLCGNTLVV